MQTSSRKALAALIFTIVLWGITPVFIRGVSVALGPADALIIRLVVAGLVFALLALFTCGFDVPRRDMPLLLLVSLIGLFGYYAGTIFGFATAPAGIGSLIMSSQPILIGLMAWVAGAERMTLATIIGLCISLAGSVLLVWDDALSESTAQGAELLWGIVLLLIASIGWAFYVVFSRGLTERLGPLKLTCLSNILIALPLLPFMRLDMPAKVSNLPAEPLTGLLLLLIVGNFSVMTWNYAAAQLKPNLLGMSLYTIPVVGVLAAWLLRGERITLQIVICAAIILLGVAVARIQTFSRTSVKVGA